MTPSKTHFKLIYYSKSRRELDISFDSLDVNLCSTSDEVFTLLRSSLGQEVDAVVVDLSVFDEQLFGIEEQKPLLLCIDTAEEEVEARLQQVPYHSYIFDIGNEYYFKLSIKSAINNFTAQEQIKRKDKRLQEHLVHLKMAMKHGNIGTFKWYVEADHLVWSDELLAIFGTNDDDFGGDAKAYLSFVPEARREEIYKKVNDLVKSNDVTKTLSYEHPILKSNGRKAWIEVRCKLVVDTFLNTIYCSGIGIDITKRKLNELKLLRTIQDRNNYREALNNSTLVSITDKEGIIVYANKEFLRISQFSKQEIVGKKHNVINSGFHGAAFWSNMWKEIKSGRMWRAEIKNRAKDGSFYWVDTMIIPILNEKKEVYQFMSVRYLISERKKLERQQVELLQDLEEYAYLTSHKLRAPLVQILGLISIINETNSKDEIIKLLDILKISTEDMDAVIRQMNQVLSRNSYNYILKRREGA